MRVGLPCRPAALLILCCANGAAFAQGTVQQPVVETFSAGTTVSVPDRGTISLGGVSGAGASQSIFGPLPTGTNRGTFARGSSAAVKVQIHDPEEMERVLFGE